MTSGLTRRATLLLPFLSASCGDDKDAPVVATRHDYPSLRFGYLPPINLNVQHLETVEGFVQSSGDDEIIGGSPVDPVETLITMARDRLKPVAQGGTATFQVTAASITRHRDTLNGVLAVRLDVHTSDDTNSGFAEARVTSTHSGPAPDLRATIYDMLKSMMFDMNVELEFQVRNKLKSWVVDAPVEPASAPKPPNPQPIDPLAEPPPLTD